MRMAKALDPRMLLAAGRPPVQPEVQPADVQTAPPPPPVEPPVAEPSTSGAVARRPLGGATRAQPTKAKPPTRKAQRSHPRLRPAPRPATAGNLQPVGTLLSAAQIAWLYRIVGQAAGERRRVSHSELVRHAIDRYRGEHDARAAAALLANAPPADGQYGSYALSNDQVGWLREVKGHALLAGVSVSQADVIRAAMEPLIGLAWRDLRDAVS
jgi:hypothetical protein